MELKRYFLLLQKWAWLLTLCFVLGIISGYAGSRLQKPWYQATAKVLVTRVSQNSDSNFASINDQQLAQTYIELLTSKSIIDEASSRLNFKIDLEKHLIIEQVRETQILQVLAEDHDPQRAAAIANTLIEILIEQNENLQAGVYISAEKSLQLQVAQVEKEMSDLQSQFSQISEKEILDQLSQVDQQITSLQNEIATLQKEIAELTPVSAFDAQKATELSEKQARLSQIQPLASQYQQIRTNLEFLGKPDAFSESNRGNPQLLLVQSTLDLYQNMYLNLLNSLEMVRLSHLQNTTNLVQIEKAYLPEKPYRPSILLNTLLGGIVAVMVAVGSIGVYEYLYKTFNTPSDIQNILGLPIIGWLIKIKREKNAKEEIYPLTQPNSPTVEAFRSMLANLELIGTPEKPLKTLLIASASPGDGKTTVAVNLAVSCALGGKKVVILDADLRHPRVHVFFDLENCVGLSNILECRADIQEATFKYKDVRNLNLTVIPSGAPCINPIELMKSKTLSELLIEISQAADLVIIDSPPLIVADAQILASKVDGVLLVIKSEQSQTELVLGALDQLRRAGANMLGVALNCIPRNRISFYGGYRFDSYFQPVGSPVLDGIASRRAGPLPRIARIFANLIKKSA